MRCGSLATRISQPQRRHNSDASPSDTVLNSLRLHATIPLPLRSSAPPVSGSPTSAKDWLERTAQSSEWPARESGDDEESELRRPHTLGRRHAKTPSNENVVREFC